MSSDVRGQKGVKAGRRRPESARTVRGFTKRRNWEDLYIGGALSFFPLGIMLWSLRGCFVDAGVERRLEDNGWDVSGTSF